jgi:hypothetical protein
MKIAFWLGIVLGLGGVLAGSHFYPWVAHARLPSQTTVVANGGRAERFLIRLPADRLGSSGGPGTGLRGSPTVATMSLPEPLAGGALLIEHFKLRDGGGNVIGLAARHWNVGPEGPSTAWSLLIPSRGALLLAAAGEAPAALDAALQRSGFDSRSAWEGSVRVELAPSDAARILAGTAEFDGLTGRYSETWNVTGVDEIGELRGTIELDTVTYRGP